MSDVASLLERIEARLIAERPDYYKQLRPGVSDEALDAFEKQFSLKLPPEFRALYRWHDGQDPNSSANFYRNRMFTNLADLAETKDLLDGMIGFDFEDPEYWRVEWVPFLHNGGGSYLCVDTSSGKLVAFWKADEDRPVEYPNLEALLREMVAKEWKADGS